MYMIDDMVDLSLGDAEDWTSPAHRVVAQNVCLCNPLIKNRSTLMETGRAINAIPKAAIKKATLVDLAMKYQVPNIRLS